ncbi:type IX secretion system membrane protein, PorP/SprF family [Arenibacter nanhaiticus]|uniref:Type IX secretion system membrane protein, PorP/SprF family n=2 Tax=Arenibacter nanhaiticus TaxID=558155 RepID=A0A1M6K1H7_9FLAO|nr:type IX secretion system membrane protein, PorP/SprF family [Arenibacter nanhaiticus]
MTVVSYAQVVELPQDLRHHNLSLFNSSLLHPAHSLKSENRNTIAYWSRYQWQHIDGNPTTFYLNYTRQLNTSSAMGVGLLQHNTGVFLNTGGMLNYAFSFNLAAKIQVAFGVNVMGYKSAFADHFFPPNPDISLPQLKTSDDFIVQFSPGVMFAMAGFSIGFTSENIFDYNFSDRELHTRKEERIYLGVASYHIPVSIFDRKKTLLEPMVYLKTTANDESQLGLGVILKSEKFWLQGGYNSFYGASGGVGGVFLKRFFVGALVEFGVDSRMKGKDPSFEIVTAFGFGQ